MDISTLSEKSGIPPRTLRYVIDQELIPGFAPRHEGRGRARQFTEDEAVKLLLAATLFALGLPAAMLRTVFSAKTFKTTAIEVGRFQVGWERGCVVYKHDGVWIKLPELTKMGKRTLSPGRPLAVADVDLFAIRKLVRNCHDDCDNGRPGRQARKSR